LTQTVSGNLLERRLEKIRGVKRMLPLGCLSILAREEVNLTIRK
jgi:hypothetical protein